MKNQSSMVVNVVPVQTKTTELNVMLDLLILAELRINEANKKVEVARQAMLEAEQIARNSCSIFRILQVIKYGLSKI